MQLKGQTISFEILILAVVSTTIISIIAQQSTVTKEYYEQRLDRSSNAASILLFANTSKNTLKTTAFTNYCYSTYYANGTKVYETASCSTSLANNCKSISTAQRFTICGNQTCVIKVRTCN